MSEPVTVIVVEPDHNLMEDRTTEQLIIKYNQFYNMSESSLHDDSLSSTKEVFVARYVIDEGPTGDMCV